MASSAFDTSQQRLHFGCIDGERGKYCQPAQSLESLLSFMPEFEAIGVPKLLTAGVDALDLRQAGWGVVWPEVIPEAVRQVLAPLLERRQRQAGERFRQLQYFSGESLFDFLERYDAGPDSVNPAKVPYYLLLVGSPEHLPFGLQGELAVSRAVGRVSFESAAGYADYAERIAAYEGHVSKAGSAGSAGSESTRKAAFFGVENPDDPATASSVENFIKPLEGSFAQQRRSWRVDTHLRQGATKARLRELLLGDRRPSVVFTAGHAVRYRPDSAKQATHQGALICADWPGPEEWQGPMLDEHLFSGGDIPAAADLSGLMAFLFGCYSAGTPRFESYGFEKGKILADKAFVSPLPRTLLRRGALAVIGHVDLAIEQSFLWFNAGPQLQVYSSVLHEITAGVPVGHAFRHLSQRHAQLAVHAAAAARRIAHPVARTGATDPLPRLQDFRLWAAYEDARNYLLLGDPAARIRV